MDIEKLAAKAKEGLPPKDDKAKEKAEPKGAAPDPSSEIKKTEATDEKAKGLTKDNLDKAAKAAGDLAREAEAQAKKDEELLAKKDEELDVEQKKRKAEIVEKDKKSNVQKRIDELTAKTKELEADKEATKAERDAVKAELEGIKKKLSMTPDDEVKEKVKSALSANRKKALEEDVKLPKEDRREMVKEELDEWLLEDYEGATDWIARRSLRRAQEEQGLKHEEAANKRAGEIKAKQEDSAKRAFAKHPELDIEDRKAELVKQGKTKEEIRATIIKDNPKYKLALEILEENPQKYILAENGPELIAQELEKRLTKKEPEGNSEIEGLKKRLAALEAENEILKNLDSGITSSREGNPPDGQETELDKQRVKLAAKVGLSPERIKKRVAERVKQGYDG